MMQKVCLRAPLLQSAIAGIEGKAERGSRPTERTATGIGEMYGMLTRYGIDRRMIPFARDPDRPLGKAFQTHPFRPIRRLVAQPTLSVPEPAPT